MSAEASSHIGEFLRGGLCVIVEPSAAYAMSLKGDLINIGISPAQIIIARKFDDAKNLIIEKKPKILVTEYDLPDGSGLYLAELQELQYESSERMSIIVTCNSTDSAVAEAAEGPVDAYLLKPFSPDAFRVKLEETVYRKIRPSPYQTALAAGRKKASQKLFDEALKDFAAAKLLDDKPTLAYFLSGQAYQEKGDRPSALLEFQKGRRLQPLHYRCLIGEFECFMSQDRYAEAYSLVPVIRKNFPVTSKRLGQIFISAVYTKHFDDLPGLYEIFKKLGSNSWLAELVSLALLTAGRFWIQKNNVAKAMIYFKMAIDARARELKFLEIVIDELLKVNAVADANWILSNALSADIGTPLYSQLRFKIELRMPVTGQTIDKGHKMVLDGKATPEIYRLLIEMLSKEGKTTLAESIIVRAAQEYPDLKPTLYKILENSQKM